MSIGYSRMVDVKQDCVERFDTLMQAYASFARACCPEAQVAARQSAGRPGRFVVHEEFPTRSAMQEVRSRSHFDELWLPVILSLIEGVEIRELSEAVH